MSKLFDGGAYAHQRLNHGTKGKAHGRNAKASNRTCEKRLSGIIGGPRETQPWWNCDPASQTERARTVTLHLQAGAPELYPNRSTHVAAAG